ncbi:hypothetical protein FRB96_001195 [Tulasnella sp. 330]|nr:hypothetical protein FRB96_001195 [Tulasnella sp. 330]
MSIIPTRYKLVFFVPRSHTKVVLHGIFHHVTHNCTDSFTIGRIGAYDECAFVTPGTGQFRPCVNADPVIGQVGVLEYVEEDRVEVPIAVHSKDQMHGIIAQLKSLHPYEEVAYDVYKLEDF